MKKICVTTTTFAEYDERSLELLTAAGFEVVRNPYKKTLTEPQIQDLCGGAAGIIAGTESYTAAVLKKLLGLRVLSRVGVGVDAIDLEAAKELGIKVFNTPEGPTRAVSELTIGLMLDLLRLVPAMDREVRVGVWKKRMGHLLQGRKVGIIGFGRIGQKVAELLMPFGVEIHYFDTHTVKSSLTCMFKPMNELLAWADIITLHCSSLQDDRPLIGKEELKNMKKGAWLINTSRGRLVDERSLYLSLKEGHLSGAALDVFEKEPYEGSLSELDNIILTPHIGSYAKEARIKMEIDAVENLLAGLTCDPKERKI